MTTKAYLIDPVSKIITLVDVGDFTDIQKHIGCRHFTTAVQFTDGDVLYVDDEGLIHPGNYSFNVEGANQPFLGNGLLMGNDNEGDSRDPVMDMLSFAQKVNFDPQYISRGM